MKGRGTFFLCLVLLLLATGTAIAEEALHVLEKKGVRVLYGVGGQMAAERITELSPDLYRELETATGLKMDFQPTVFPVTSRDRFYRLGGEDGYVAFAIPGRNQVVMDLSRFERRPASFRPVLKHEYSHLLLNRYISAGGLPRWLDEGLAQYFSDGLSEYLPGRQQLNLGEALAAGRVMDLSDLQTRFPTDAAGRLLAYEQSRRMVGYMARRFGDSFLTELIDRLSGGMSVDKALRSLSGITLVDMEAEWRRHEASPLAWMGRMAGNIYGILFFLAALATLIGFWRHRRRRRAYADDEDDVDNAA